MKENSFKTNIFLLLALIVTFNSIAQSSINSSGGDATGSDGNVAFSIGSVVYTSNDRNNGNIEQGVQHAYQIFSVGVKDATLDVSMSVFPNPTLDNLILQTSDFKTEKLQYQLIDVQGKIVSNGSIVALQTLINMLNFPSATYFLNVLNAKNQKVQSFKIIKNQ